jgi:hypothetical protein
VGVRVADIEEQDHSGDVWPRTVSAAGGSLVPGFGSRDNKIKIGTGGEQAGKRTQAVR